MFCLMQVTMALRIEATTSLHFLARKKKNNNVQDPKILTSVFT